MSRKRERPLKVTWERANALNEALHEAPRGVPRRYEICFVQEGVWEWLPTLQDNLNRVEYPLEYVDHPEQESEGVGALFVIEPLPDKPR